MSDKLESKLKAAQAGDVIALAEALTLIERTGPKALAESSLLANPGRAAFRVGITGPPGAGKSTLIAGLLSKLKSKGQKIAVLAVDPTSPITSGAILGDRIRYNEHTLDQNIFIRSLGTRGSLGGLSASAYLMLRAFDVCGYNWVIVETVGVGQVEVEVMNVADTIVLVLVPESGDSIQAMKAGLIEVSDYIVVNKNDRPGAEAFKLELQAAIEMSENPTAKKTEILSVSALEGRGVTELAEKLISAKSTVDIPKQRALPARLQAEARALLRYQIESEVQSRVAKVRTVSELQKILS